MEAHTLRQFKLDNNESISSKPHASWIKCLRIYSPSPIPSRARPHGPPLSSTNIPLKWRIFFKYSPNGESGGKGYCRLHQWCSRKLSSASIDGPLSSVPPRGCTMVVPFASCACSHGGTSRDRSCVPHGSQWEVCVPRWLVRTRCTHHVNGGMIEVGKNMSLFMAKARGQGSIGTERVSKSKI
jgi:hypothetical protein